MKLEGMLKKIKISEEFPEIKYFTNELLEDKGMANPYTLQMVLQLLSSVFAVRGCRTFYAYRSRRCTISIGSALSKDTEISKLASRKKPSLNFYGLTDKTVRHRDSIAANPQELHANCDKWPHL